METWETSVVAGWTSSLGLAKLVGTAVEFVSLWDYFSLALVFTSVWLYRVLDFHLVRDLLCGFRGEVPRLHYNPASKVAAKMLPKCHILKERSDVDFKFCSWSSTTEVQCIEAFRYFATPLLSSPHLQTAFLHFSGNPPPIKYHRQLYMTPDKGTIALDWVDPPLGNANDHQGNPELDETPRVLIIPGLTSDSKDPYLKHMAYTSAMQGWRTLVSNHRGLGGVSITSDQFYNVGWTEDLRRIINYVNSRYPQAPLFMIGTSIGANILVKYLGEESSCTPVGAAAAICNPWDLLVGDRFISRKGVRRLYNRVLDVGLLQYAMLHQTVLIALQIGKISARVKQFEILIIIVLDIQGNTRLWTPTIDDAAVRTSCQRLQFLCYAFSALDDPVCTREALPWDEVVGNPNVIMASTKHGGHLAVFEGFTAWTIWWTRALIEYMTVMIPSILMHAPQKVPVPKLRNRGDPYVDKAPNLNVPSLDLVAQEEL